MNRIVIDSDICNGLPTIQGTRIAARTVLEFLAAGDSIEDVLEEYPTLTREDVLACLAFSSELMKHQFCAKSRLKGFLFDENLPARVAFTPGLPVVHARDLGQSVSDSALWAYAQKQDLAIVSKDADFSQRIMIASPPPWVVHLRFGNLRRKDFHSTLARLWPVIESFLPDHKLVNVYLDRIEAVKD